MFRGNRKRAAVLTKSTVVVEENISDLRGEVSLQQKMKKPKEEKLPGPRPVPELIGKHIVNDYKVNADLMQFLKVVVRKRPQKAAVFDYRIFDQSEAEALEVKVKDYSSLDEHEELIFYDGWFDEDTRQVEMTEKKKVRFRVPLFTEAEIQQKIDVLSQPGSTVFFYLARGAARGGPLGMGAAVVELNPDRSNKKKKYNIYTTSVVGMEPLDNKKILYSSNKSKEIASWIKESHCKRTY
jgi:hypothetical protein